MKEGERGSKGEGETAGDGDGIGGAEVHSRDRPTVWFGPGVQILQQDVVGALKSHHLGCDRIRRTLIRNLISLIFEPGRGND